MTAVDHLRQEQFTQNKTYMVPISMVDRMQSGDFPGKTMRGVMRLPADERRGYRTDKHDEAEFVAHVREHGVREPLLVQQTARGATVVDGHHRYAAARKAGVTHVPLRPFYPEEGPLQ